MRHLLSFLLTAGYLSAIQHSGSIRAADQFLPGVTVTARQGGAKVVTCTDESGRYTLDLTPGFWQIQVELFGFQPASTKIDVGNEPTTYDWTLEMPRAGDPPAAAIIKPQATPSRKPPPVAGFQSMSIQATTEGTQALAAEAAPPPEIAVDTDSFVVNGSMSGGLAAAADEQTRREKQVACRFGAMPRSRRRF